MDHRDDIRCYVLDGLNDPCRENEPLSADQIRAFSEHLIGSKTIHASLGPISPAEWEERWEPVLTMCIDCQFSFGSNYCIGCLRASGKGKMLLKELEDVSG